MPDESKKKKNCAETGTDGFPIRDFPDLRSLRHAYLRKDGKPIGVDSADNPRPDDPEEDFGLRRSTAEEALEFLRQSTEDCQLEDDLTEFLDDQ